MPLNNRLKIRGLHGGCLLQSLIIILALTRTCIGTRDIRMCDVLEPNMARLFRLNSVNDSSLVVVQRPTFGEITFIPRSPASDFSEHSIVQPRLHHGRTKREISSTRDTAGGHHSEVQVTVPIDGEQRVLELRLNEELVAGGHTLQYQQGGETVRHKPKKEELDLCHYSGSVRGKPQSWVAVSTCHGVRGVIFDGKKMRYIEPAQGAKIQSSHYIYDHKDLLTDLQSQKYSGQHMRQSETVHNIGHVTNNTIYHIKKAIKKNRANRNKRETNTQLREPYNADKSSRYVELVLVADHAEFRASGRDVWAVHSQLTQMANIINSMFAPLNIFIALVEVVVWSERDEIRITHDGDDTLFQFLKYRQKLAINTPHDNAYLMTHRGKFDQSAVGKSLPSTMCKPDSSGGVAVNFTEVIGLEAATVAHEIGHNFGMHHDENCEIMRCPDRKCIMTAISTSLIPVHWSSCSVKALEKSFEQGLDYCLHNKPKRLFNSPTCGNGFVEPGEECDCGVTVEGIPNPCHACCHPDTCRLRETATCGAGACCDFTTCRPKSAGAVCRSAERECDLPEYCTGHSEYCPADVHKMDSTPCGQGEDQAYCMRGSCSSHSAQCRLLWGARGSSHHKCYSLKNTNGTEHGNCGYDPASQTYKPCAPRDVLCGLLQCNTEEFRLEHAMESNAETEVSSYVQDRTRFDCYTAKFNLGGNYVDLGLVPDGAKCGHEQMCVNQRCQSVKAVQEEIARHESSVCPSDCSGHGVCNSKGHCHCDAGFAPPLCAAPGSGGSLDSGPVSKPSNDPVYSRHNIELSSGSVNSRRNNNPNSGSVNSRPNNKPNSDSGYSRANNKPNSDSGYSRANNKPNSDSGYSRANTEINSGSGYSRPNNKPNSDSGYSRANTEINSGSGYSRLNNKPNSDSGYSRANTEINSGSGYSRPNNKPNSDSGYSRANTEINSGSGYSRPNNKPNSDSGYSRANTEINSGSGYSRPNNKPNSDSGYSRANTEINSGSGYSRLNNKPNSDSGYSRRNNKPNAGSGYSRANTESNSDSGYSRRNNKLNAGSGYSRANTESNSDSGYSRPNNKPNSDSGYSRANTEINSGSSYSRPNNKPNSDSGYSRRNNKPNAGSGYSRANTESNSDSGYSRPNNKPNSDSGYSRANTEINSGSSYSRPNNNPNSDSGYSRPNNKPNSGSGYSRPNNKPNSDSGYSKRNNTPNTGSVYSRPSIETNSDSVYYRPNNKPNSGSVYPSPNTESNHGSVYPRPNTETNSGSGYSRPNTETNGGSGYSRSNTEPNHGSVHSRPNTEPNSGSVYTRPNTNLNSGSVYPRPNPKPNHDSVYLRPSIEPNHGSVYPRPNNKPNNDFVIFTPTTKSSSGYVTKPTVNRPTVYTPPEYKPTVYRPSTTPRSGFVITRTTKNNSGYATNRPTIESRNGFHTGGSELTTISTSGPVDPRSTTDTSVQRNFAITMYVIFLGVIPSIILIAFLIYYTRHNELCNQPKKLYVNCVTCCTKNFCKGVHKMKTNRSNYNNIYKEDTDKNVEKATLAVEPKLKKPNLTKDDIQVVSNNVQFNPIEPVLNIYKDDTPITNSDINLKSANAMSNNNKDNMQLSINNVKLKPVKPPLKIDNHNTQIMANDVKLNSSDALSNMNKDNNTQLVFSNVKLNPVKPALKTNSKDIQITTHNVKLKLVKPMSKTYNNNIQVPNNGVLKRVNPMSNTDKPDIQPPANIVALKPVLQTSKNDIKKTTHNVTFNRVKPMAKTDKDEVQVPAFNVKLKPVKPLMTDEHKPPITSKPEWLNLKAS